MSYSVNLHKESSPDIAVTGVPGLRVKYTISTVTGFADTGLFLFQGTKFVCVCTPADLHDYSMGVVVDGSQFVRANTVEVVSPTAEEADEVNAYIESDLQQLVRSMTTLQLVSGTSTISIS